MKATYHQDHCWGRISEFTITVHSDTVSMHRGGYCFDHGHGFCLEFTPVAIESLRELTQKLEQLRDLARVAKSGRPQMEDESWC